MGLLQQLLFRLGMVNRRKRQRYTLLRHVLSSSGVHGATPGLMRINKSLVIRSRIRPPYASKVSRHTTCTHVAQYSHMSANRVKGLLRRARHVLMGRVTIVIQRRSLPRLGQQVKDGRLLLGTLRAFTRHAIVRPKQASHGRHTTLPHRRARRLNRYATKEGIFLPSVTRPASIKRVNIGHGSQCSTLISRLISLNFSRRAIRQHSHRHASVVLLSRLLSRQSLFSQVRQKQRPRSSLRTRHDRATNFTPNNVRGSLRRQNLRQGRSRTSTGQVQYTKRYRANAIKNVTVFINCHLSPLYCHETGVSFVVRYPVSYATKRATGLDGLVRNGYRVVSPLSRQFFPIFVIGTWRGAPGGSVCGIGGTMFAVLYAYASSTRSYHTHGGTLFSRPSIFCSCFCAVRLPWAPWGRGGLRVQGGCQIIVELGWRPSPTSRTNDFTWTVPLLYHTGPVGSRFYTSEVADFRGVHLYNLIGVRGTN